MLSCLTFLCLVIVAISKDNKAILVSSSIGYYNYRQTSNLLSLYQQLKYKGFSDESITLMMPENGGCCEKNPLPGSVSLYDNDYTNYNTDTQLDHRFSTFTVKELFDLLRGRHSPNLLNRRRI
jgi:glycosylphosphatidylinositol transamidase (GPIT) subunit GPI8